MRLPSPPRAVANLRLPAIGLVVAIVAAVGIVRLAGPPATAAISGMVPGAMEVGDRARGTYRVGEHTVLVASDSLTISHPRSPGFVWASPPGRAFLLAGVGEPDLIADRGILRVADTVERAFVDQTVEGADLDADGRLVITGALVEPGTEELRHYQMFLEGTVRGGEEVSVQVRVLGEVDAVSLHGALEPDEVVHGLGAQYVADDLRGRVYPIIPRAQGVGRGQQPLSLLVDLLTGAAGSGDTTPAPLPHYVTSAPRSAWVHEGDGVVVVDLRQEGRVGLTTWGQEMTVALGVGETPARHVTAHAAATGTMPRPPRWLDQGVVAGLVGGDEEVLRQLEALRAGDVPVAAVWIPDWAGPRPSALDARHLGGVVPDADAYPEWADLVADLSADGVRVLARVTPTLRTTGPEADLFAEAAEAGHLVTDGDGAPYLLGDAGETAGLVDLLAPRAREWFARVLAERVLGTGVSGFEADLGAALPLDAVTAEGTGVVPHNAYPTAWATTTRMALELAGLEGEGLVWHRAAAPGSVPSAGMFAVAEQLTDFSGADGLPSVLDGLLSGGISGLALMHHGIGGEHSLVLPGPLPDITRSTELLVRSAELAAFTPMMRSTPGSHPDAGASITDPAVLTHLAGLVELHVALAPERLRLATRAALDGLPVVRHPVLVIPEQPQVARQPDLFFLGEDLLVAPVLQEGVERREVTLPAGSWVDVWSGEQVDVARNAVAEITVDAPLGRPPAWARAGALVAGELARWREDP